jgi:hypothetical protein
MRRGARMDISHAHRRTACRCISDRASGSEATRHFTPWRVTNVSLILEAPVRTLKPAPYINSVYAYDLAANASGVIHHTAAVSATLRCGSPG